MTANSFRSIFVCYPEQKDNETISINISLFKNLNIIVPLHNFTSIIYFIHNNSITSNDYRKRNDGYISYKNITQRKSKNRTTSNSNQS